MAASEPNPRQTLAVLFGASSYRRAPKLAQGRSFYNSAQDFHEYLIATEGLGIPRENINWLFDDSRSPSDQLQDIRDFLESRSMRLKSEGAEPQDLILYYVGHGLFWGSDHTYSFAIRATNEDSEGLTSIRAGDLASVIKAHARFLRKFLILDCCFSAAAYKEFQSGPLTASRVKLLDDLPQRGTTLLCSASAQDPSLAPEGLSRTMFSNGLLKALRQGHVSLGPRLSLCELGDLVKLQIHEDYPDTGVRPEIHSPDQREGDVGCVPVFPNPAYLEAQRKAKEELVQESVEAERRAHEAARVAQHKAEVEAERARAEAEQREKAAVDRRICEAKEEAQRKAKTQLSAEVKKKAQVERHAQEVAERSRLEAQAQAKADLEAAEKANEEHSNQTARVALIAGTQQESANEAITTDTAKGHRRRIWIAASIALVVLGVSLNFYFFFRDASLFTLHQPEVSRIAWVDNERLAADGLDLKIWDGDNGRELRSLGHAFFGVAWSPDGKRLASRTGHGEAKIWDAATGQQLLDLHGHTAVVTSIAWSPDGNRLATGSHDTTTKIWDARSGQELLDLPSQGYGADVESIAWSPDGKWLATAGDFNMAIIWDAASGQKLRSLVTGPSTLWCIAWNPDGKRLAIANDSVTVNIWDVNSEKEVLALSDHSATVVAWSPDGEWIATAGYDQVVRIWDTRSGHRLTTLHGHSAKVIDVAWSPDSRRLASASYDGWVKIWNVDSKK